MGGCITCCAAALIAIGLASLGHSATGGMPHAISTANIAHAQLLQARAQSSNGMSSAKSRSLLERYKQFPLSFEPNLQQTDNADVKFLARGDGYILFLTRNDAVLSMGRAAQSTSILRMSLLGANNNPTFSGMDELPGKSNYMISNRPEKWHTNIPNYRKVSEHNIYPGIDLVYYGTQRQLEYDFVIAPGASPSKVQIAFSGATNVHTDANGDLVLSVAGSDDVRLQKPIAYQQIGDEKKLVAANYILNGNNNIEFAIGNYDATLPLIVDPILAYSTYLGGSGIDGANSIALAPDNTAFVAGLTFSSDFPTVHALQGNRGGGPDFPQDAFVAKISADGSTLLYSTYLGGKDVDVATGIAVDNPGNAYVTGYTHSPDFPVTFASLNLECGGDGRCGASWNPGGLIVSNAFVTKLNPAGSALIFSTFLGEYEQVQGSGIAVDGNGNVYVTGQTSVNFTPTVPIIPPALPPPPFPITSNAFQPTFGGGSLNAFVTKIDPTGSSILYSSYLGGEVEDIGYGITVDSNSNAYVTGVTYSATFPTTPGALQFANGGAGDAFVSKINPAGSALLYSTYIGGTGLDQGNGITVDSTGNAYVAGLTNSVSFGFAPNGFQTANHGQGDAFVAKLRSTGQLSYFTYLGGSKADAATGIAVDPLNNVYITGSTVSTDFPTAGAVFQPLYGGGNADSFVAKLDPTGKTLVYSSYLGGTNTEISTGIAVDTTGSAYVTGQTCSEDFPLANPLQAVPGGNCDAYVAKVTILTGLEVNPANLVFPAQSLKATSQTQTVTVTNGDNLQTLTGITLSGANPGDFLESNTCPIAPAQMAVGATCTITVSFTPTGAGLRKAFLTITDTLPANTLVVNLSGSTSTVTLSTSSLTFSAQQIGIPSAPQTVTVTNSGSGALTFTSIAASGDFSETDNCTKVQLQSGSTCVIQVIYTPSAVGQSIGAITLADNGTGSPQTISTTGTGLQLPPFQISSLTAIPAVPAGKAANFAISVVSPNGFTQPVALNCIAPATITCSIAPSVVTPSASPSPSALVTVSTSLRTIAPPSSGFRIDPISLLRNFGRTWVIWLVALFMVLAASIVRRRPMSAAFGLAVVLLLASAACSKGGTAGVPAGTPAGSYQITVTGTSGATVNSTILTMQVN